MASVFNGTTKEAFRRLLPILGWVPVAVTFVQVGISMGTVSGQEMKPTLNPDPSKRPDVVLLNRWRARRCHYNVGDVVTLKSPIDPNVTITRRIVGLPGNQVRTKPPFPDRVVHVPSGHCWVEGDDYEETVAKPTRFKAQEGEGLFSVVGDSNTFGPVPLGLVTSRVSCVIWPPSRMHIVDHTPPSKILRRVGLGTGSSQWRS